MKKIISTHSHEIFFFILIFLVSCQSGQKTIKIACVGDSITEGYGIYPESSASYPAVLDSLLDERYVVLNAGRSAATLQKSGNLPYWNTNEFYNVFAFQPDMIVIKLGTNDTKPVNWNAENFEMDYQALIDTFKTISPQPKIFLCQPVPVFQTNWGINDSTLIDGVIPVVSKVAKANNLTLIDLHQDLNNQQINFPDGVHPNEKAAKVIAEAVARVIKGDN